MLSSRVWWGDLARSSTNCHTLSNVKNLTDITMLRHFSNRWFSNWQAKKKNNCTDRLLWKCKSRQNRQCASSVLKSCFLCLPQLDCAAEEKESWRLLWRWSRSGYWWRWMGFSLVTKDLGISVTATDFWCRQQWLCSSNIGDAKNVQFIHHARYKKMPWKLTQQCKLSARGTEFIGPMHVSVQGHTCLPWSRGLRGQMFDEEGTDCIPEYMYLCVSKNYSNSSNQLTNVFFLCSPQQIIAGILTTMPLVRGAWWTPPGVGMTAQFNAATWLKVNPTLQNCCAIALADCANGLSPNQ